MSFQQALSGLNTASKNLDVIGNNVANASVVGFKTQSAQFADVFANSLSGAGAGAVGIGAKISSVAQTFAQGAISVTDNPLDLAVNGKGFFRLDDNGAATYSRNGQFQFDKDGYIVNDQKLRLTGYGADANGNIQASAPIPILISFSDLPPAITTDFNLAMNLDANATVPAVGVFNPADPDSFNQTTSGSVYDSLGNSHIFSMYFVKTATALQWQMYATVDGGAASAVNLGGGAGVPATFNFTNTGVLSGFTPLTASLTLTSGAVTPLALNFDITGSTQYGSPFSVNTLTQDGYGSGRLAGFNIRDDGIIVGRYTNGRTRDLGQVVLADFRNPQGLNPLGGNMWEETSESGLAIVGIPQSGAFGSLQSSAVEDSTVDLTAELVDMITAQRVYQANAQTIKTQDQVMQTLVNLR